MRQWKAKIKKLLKALGFFRVLHFMGQVGILCLRCLPGILQATIKQNYQTVKKLDYKKRNIFIHVDSQVEYLNRLNACKKEPETVEWIETFVKPGDTVYDIGANVGAYAFVIDAFHGGKCLTYAFEPSFSTFAQLSRNIFLNECQDRVIPLHIALSDKTGMASFRYRNLVSGSALHALESDQQSDFEAIYRQPILTYSMDDLVGDLAVRAPNHIKLDVDGIEVSILKGAGKTLSNPHLRSILIEIDPPQGTYTEATKILQDHGFDLQSKHPHGNTADATCNFIFVRNN